jgi:hypothetical protein
MPDWVADKKKRAEKIRAAKAELEAIICTAHNVLKLAQGRGICLQRSQWR